MTPVLQHGLWLHVWIEHPISPAQVAEQLRAIGGVGVVVHSVGTAAPSLAWIQRARAGRDLDGLETAVGIGSRGPKKWRSAFAQPIVDALAAGQRVVADWEGAWDAAGGQSAGRCVASMVLASVPDAVGRVADDCWWAPLTQPGGGQTHPHAPTREFGALAATRYVQCYPSVGDDGLQRDGAALRELAWARSASQYPALGTPAASVFATVRGYARSPHDACEFALAEPHHVVYLGSRDDAPNVLTPEVRRGLIAARAIAVAGHTSIAAWQAAAGLAADGVLGPRSLAALGL